MRSSRCPAGWADRRQRVINERHATGIISYPALIVSCNTPISATTERMRATGTGQPRSTASRRRLRTAGHPWQDFDARTRRDSLDHAREHMGDEQLKRAYAQGLALGLDKGLDLALGKPGPA